MRVGVCARVGGGGGEADPDGVSWQVGERDEKWGGKCVKGPYPSVLHIFAEAAGGAWLTDEWGVRG